MLSLAGVEGGTSKRHNKESRKASEVQILTRLILWKQFRRSDVRQYFFLGRFIHLLLGGLGTGLAGAADRRGHNRAYRRGLRGDSLEGGHLHKMTFLGGREGLISLPILLAPLL